MTLETAAARARLRCFLAVEETEGATDDTPLVEGVNLTIGDLRNVLGDVDQLDAAVERTVARMRAYGSGSVNVRQVISLLSPTWPDGNYEAPAPHAPLTDEPCGVVPTPAGTAAVLDYKTIRREVRPRISGGPS